MPCGRGHLRLDLEKPAERELLTAGVPYPKRINPRPVVYTLKACGKCKTANISARRSPINPQQAWGSPSALLCLFRNKSVSFKVVFIPYTRTRVHYRLTLK